MMKEHHQKHLYKTVFIFLKNLKENLKWLFENCLYLPDSSIPKDYVLNHMVSDFAETINWWMKNENYSPEDVCSFYLKTTPYLRSNEKPI